MRPGDLVVDRFPLFESLLLSFWIVDSVDGDALTLVTRVWGKFPKTVEAVVRVIPTLAGLVEC